MSKKRKKRKKSGHKHSLEKIVLVTATINLLISIIELISKMFD